VQTIRVDLPQGVVAVAYETRSGQVISWRIG
jgi:hypothetical protein